MLAVPPAHQREGEGERVRGMERKTQRKKATETEGERAGEMETEPTFCIPFPLILR